MNSTISEMWDLVFDLDMTVSTFKEAQPQNITFDNNDIEQTTAASRMVFKI